MFYEVFQILDLIGGIAITDPARDSIAFMTDQGYAGSLSLHLLDMCWLGIGFEVLTGLCLPPISVRML